MADDPLAGLPRRTQQLGIDITPEALSKLATLLELLLASNAQLNLTGTRDRESIIQRHFLESLALGAELERCRLIANGARVLDLGSGAGFPGIPIKVVWPGIDLWLLEATAKKARFIESAATSLRLRGAGVLTGRAETLAHHPQLRESFDLTLARAVAPLPTLVELALPFLRLGGHLAAMKGSRAGQEIADAAKALELCGGMVAKELPVVEGASLGLILVRKSSPTPDRFPRRPGQPASHPLGT